jgi:antitoxin VapB
MGINIKNPETEKLVQELADATGLSLTAAVTEAVREKLARIRRKGLADRLMEIGHEMASRMTEEERTFDYDAFLYDEETGLRK